MSGNDSKPELPDLSDEDIKLLYQICHQANSLDAPPVRSLFDAYDHVFREQDLDKEHDSIIFSYVLHLGEPARKGERSIRDGRVDLVGRLKSTLAARGVSIYDQENGDATSEVTRDFDGRDAHRTDDRRVYGGRKQPPGRRRVSFNDADMDATWRSDAPSPSVRIVPPGPQAEVNGLSASSTRRGSISGVPERRTRSTSSHRSTRHHARQPAPKHRQASQSSVYTSEPDEQFHHDSHNPTLFFQPSKAQLERNAEAFASTAAIRTARQVLHVWHDRALVQQEMQKQALAIATAHDRHIISRQTFDRWYEHLHLRRKVRAQEAQARAQEVLLQQHDRLATDRYRDYVLRKAFTHWAQSTTDQRAATAMGARHMLRYRYFHRWKTIAQENALKARSLLVRKYLAVWRERLTRRQFQDEQAVALCEEHRVKRCWTLWFWHFCSRRVETWRDDNTKRRAMYSLKSRTQALRQAEDIAAGHHSRRIATRAFTALRARLAQCQEAAVRATSHFDRVATIKCLGTLTACARLEPLARTFTLKIRLDLQRKALRVWHLHLTLSHQASEVERKRILQTAWTQWNDALRCKALSQKIDERIVIESLYKWVLAERMRLFRRAMDGKLPRKVMSVWSGRLLELRSSTRQAEIAFAEAQQRRILSSGMVAMNIAMRRREDAERAAIEFGSERALPHALDKLTAKLREVQKYNRWAAEGRFYTLCKRTLAIWRERATEHQHNRKRNAYATIRARIKIRVARDTLVKWRSRTALQINMDAGAEQMRQQNLHAAGGRALLVWRDKTLQIRQMDEQAASMDSRRLLASAISAIARQYADVAMLDERAIAFRQDIDLALLATVLKKLQWQQFTASRKAESAEALWARNRDSHIRNMLRTWATQTAERRAARAEPEQEPESPSLRPASRAAERHRPLFQSSPPGAGSATPAYMRTPSRSRRAGRFRPLPTPAAFTPFAFEESYLATTPAPLPQATATGLDALAPQVTPFARKLRAGGFASISRDTGPFDQVATPAPALRQSVLGRSIGQGAGGTAKSVRFAGSSRFGGSGGRLKSS